MILSLSESVVGLWSLERSCDDAYLQSAYLRVRVRMFAVSVCVCVCVFNRLRVSVRMRLRGEHSF